MPIEFENITYFTIEEAAAKLGKHTVTVRNMMRLGQLPGFKFGRRWYVSEHELHAAFKKQNDMKPRPQAGSKG